MLQFLSNIIAWYDSMLQNNWFLPIVLVLGFVLLVKGADWLVDGASSIAKKFGVSDLVIGLTVVAFGTSMPEFVVNMISAGQGNSALAITNVLGSNAINIFVILGVTALIWPVSSERQSRLVDIPYAYMGALLIFIYTCLSFPFHWSTASDGSDYITRGEGLLLFVGFLTYMHYLVRQTLKTRSTLSPSIPDAATSTAPNGTSSTAPNGTLSSSQSAVTESPLALSEQGERFGERGRGKGAILLIFLGLLGLTMGGEMCVDSATTIASKFGISDAIIGLTIVALGTSLPELATSVIAALKHNSDMALGNCVGSCIFNTYFVLALTAIVSPLRGYDGLWLDTLMAFLGPALVWLFVMKSKDHKVTRAEGALLLVVYAIYMTFRIFQTL